MTDMFSQQGEKIEFEKPVEAKGAPASSAETLTVSQFSCQHS